MNCQGLRNSGKRNDVLNYLKTKNVDILCLQDTHLKASDQSIIEQNWDGEVLLHGVSTNSRGVAILIRNTLQYELLTSETDKNGNIIVLHINCLGQRFLIINVYGPNTDSPTFFNDIKNYIDKYDHDYFTLCGDLNISLNPEMDTCNYVGLNNPKARESLHDLIQTCSLIDLYRYFHPNTRRYTWRRKNPIKQARLDYFIGSQTLLDLVTQVDIKPGYKTDHSLITLSLNLVNFSRGPGVWKFNTSLLKDQEYIASVKQWIKDEKLKYAVPVYNLENIHNIPDDKLQMKIDHDLFLEMLLMRIRGETIKYASYKKKVSKEIENNLISEIDSLEKNLGTDTYESYLEKKSQLQIIREDTIKGHQIRSRVQWLNDREKPTKYFCSLEHRNYIEKTAKKIK